MSGSDNDIEAAIDAEVDASIDNAINEAVEKAASSTSSASAASSSGSGSKPRSRNRASLILEKNAVEQTLSRELTTSIVTLLVRLNEHVQELGRPLHGESPREVEATRAKTQTIIADAEAVGLELKSIEQRLVADLNDGFLDVRAIGPVAALNDAKTALQKVIDLIPVRIADLERHLQAHKH
jgi:hypothetical protein